MKQITFFQQFFRTVKDEDSKRSDQQVLKNVEEYMNKYGSPSNPLNKLGKQTLTSIHVLIVLINEFPSFFFGFVSPCPQSENQRPQDLTLLELMLTEWCHKDVLGNLALLLMPPRTWKNLISCIMIDQQMLANQFIISLGCVILSTT